MRDGHAWDDALRMGPAAFAAERDGLAGAAARPSSWSGQWKWQRAMGTPRRRSPRPSPRPGPRRSCCRAAPGRPTASVAVPVSASAAAIPIRPVEPGDEPPAPTDAVPVRAIASEGEVPPRGHGTISIGFAGEVELEQLLPAIESLTAAIRGRPGSLPVVINIPVAGATRQVRLPLHAEWDDGLGELLARAAGLPLAVTLLAVAVEP